MRTTALTLLMLLVTIAPATAQATVQISERDCSHLVRHVAAADATYQPGIDAAGNAVAPADLDGSGQIPAPDAIIIPLTLDLADRLGIPPGGNADYLARPVIGDVVVTSEGRVTFNGTPLTSDAQHELAQQCQRQSGSP
ncbi:MAG: hypothetical protein OER92_08310 [Alphaproteobacteria bacterium]|nr:hypothetical protein [Alphaproteobacteria bacterium]